MPILPSMPALAFPGASAAVVVPNQARFWAIYMSTMQGQVTPQTLEWALNIPAAEAKSYLSQLVADGVIKQNPMLNTTISNIVKEKKDTLFERVKERLEMKSNANAANANLEAKIEPADLLEDEEAHKNVEQDNFETLDENLDLEVSADASANNRTPDEITPPPSI